MEERSGFLHQKDEILFYETPLLSIQTTSTKSTSLCCLICGKYLMNWQMQAALCVPNSCKIKKNKEYCRSTLIQSHQAYGCDNPKCDELFCSTKCQQQGYLNGHLLECGVQLSDILQINATSSSLSSSPSQLNIVPSNYGNEFRKHALKTNEVFLATRRFITTLAAPFLCSKSLTDNENIEEVLPKLVSQVLECFPPTLNLPRPLTIPHSSIMEYLSTFLPPTESNDPDDTYDSIHESWLLLYAQLVDIGICRKQFSILLSWELFYSLSKFILPLHLRPLKPGYINHKIASMSPLHFELLSICLTRSVTLVATEKSLSLPPNPIQLQDIAIIDVIDALFPKLFLTTYSSSTNSIMPSDIVQTIALQNGCKLLELLSILQQDKSSGLLTDCELQRVEQGIRLLEKGASMFMILLPRCSLMSKHSCCPSAQFTSSFDSPLSVGTNDHHHNFIKELNSSSMMVSVVCLRDVFLPHKFDFGASITQCRSGDDNSNYIDGLSFSIAPESLCLDYTARLDSLSQFPFNSIKGSPSSCQCFRCLVESKGFETFLSLIFPDTTLSLTSSIHHNRTIVTQLLGLAYLYLANHDLKSARDLLNSLFTTFEAHINSQVEFDPDERSTISLTIEKLTHALGATYLEEGNWRKAHDVWARKERIVEFHHTQLERKLSTNSSFDNSYPPLRAEREKMASYPVINIIQNIPQTDHTSFPHKSSQNSANDIESLLPWPQDFNIFQEEVTTTYTTDISSYSPLSPSSTIIQYPSTTQTSSYLSLNSKIFSTSVPILSRTECEWVVSVAEQEAMNRQEDGRGGWSTSRHYAVPTTDIPIQQIPELLSWFNTLMIEKIGPLLIAQLINSGELSERECVSINIHDAFVVKYDSGIDISEYLNPTSSSNGETLHTSSTQQSSSTRPIQRLLPLHCDQSSHSFILTLNHPYHELDPVESSQLSSFLGGGTYFPTLNQVINPGCGQMVSFLGGEIIHGGLPVLAGVRYILPVFLFISTSPSLSLSSSSSSSSPSFPKNWNGKHPVTPSNEMKDEMVPSLPSSSHDEKRTKIEFNQSSSHSFSFNF